MHPTQAFRAVLLGGALVLCCAARAAAQPGSPIQLGQTIQGTVDRRDPEMMGSHYDLYHFTGRAGQRVEVTLTSADFDAVVSVGEWVDGRIGAMYMDDNGGGGTNAKVRVTLPSNGRYVIDVSSTGTGTGAYTLTFVEL